MPKKKQKPLKITYRYVPDERAFEATMKFLANHLREHWDEIMEEVKKRDKK